MIYLDRVQNIQAFSKTSELIFDLLDFSEGSKSEAQSILYRLHEFMKNLRPELVFLLETHDSWLMIHFWFMVHVSRTEKNKKYE